MVQLHLVFDDLLVRLRKLSSAANDTLIKLRHTDPDPGSHLPLSSLRASQPPYSDRPSNEIHSCPRSLTCTTLDSHSHGTGGIRGVPHLVCNFLSRRMHPHLPTRSRYEILFAALAGLGCTLRTRLLAGSNLLLCRGRWRWLFAAHGSSAPVLAPDDHSCHQTPRPPRLFSNAPVPTLTRTLRSQHFP